MSDLSAAAAALGVPEAIVSRSAAARAAETGMTVDEVLAAWAGGDTAPAAAAAAAEEPAAEAAAPEPAAEPIAEEAPAPSPEPAPEPATTVIEPAPIPAAATVSGRPPVLIGETDNPLWLFVGVVALFIAVLLVGLVGPALPTDSPGALSSELPYSESALRGRAIYQSVGCGSCHTQMVRPVIADVGLGAVTLNDSNQVLGTRRFGPDLSNVGALLSGSQIEAIITGSGGHPALRLSQDDMSDLVAYLLESTTMTDVPEETAPDEEGPAGAEEEPAES